MKAIEQYFPVVLFIVLYKVALTHRCLFMFADVDDWCNGRDSEFPENLVTAPPPVEVKTTVKSAASSVLFWNICLSLLLVWCMYISLL